LKDYIVFWFRFQWIINRRSSQSEGASVVLSTASSSQTQKQLAAQHQSHSQMQQMQTKGKLAVNMPNEVTPEEVPSTMSARNIKAAEERAKHALWLAAGGQVKNPIFLSFVKCFSDGWLCLYCCFSLHCLTLQLITYRRRLAVYKL
jgi:hypothetical protein